MSLLGAIVGGGIALVLYLAFSASSVTHRRIDSDERIQMSQQETRRIQALAEAMQAQRVHGPARPTRAVEPPPRRARVSIENDPLNDPTTFRVSSRRLPHARRNHRGALS